MAVTVIIPAYNEEKAIGEVLSAVKSVRLIDNILVVSDGSTDSTAEIAKNFHVNVLELARNMGKGGAMKAGLDNSSGDIILFLDADLIGLTGEHVSKLIEPVYSDRADMSIGIFKGGRFATDLAQKVSPYLSGQRAVKRTVLNCLPGLDVLKFGVEVALTKYIMKNGIKVEEVELWGMSHYTKEEKLGLVKGAGARLKMYGDIIKCLKSQRMR